MSIQHALLTSLLEKPSTGYELANRFDRSIGYFWQATHQQIYRELGRMVSAGWLVAQDGPEDDKRRKKIYQVLPAGRAELMRWAGEPQEAGDQSQALLIKLRAEAVIGPLGLGAEVQRLIKQHQALLETYRQIEQRDFSSASLSTTQRLQYIVLRRGIMLEESWLAWADEVLPLIEV
ncbi:DNA-binding transcriptional regulator, PadR family [Pseudomonas gessardii]|uniref:PadR family transcriptional regulator n=1 Tax=Pseudomonas gessardii TaxID=78544 RepID=A0A7Y1QN31_9PSED|nr:MULTISPECIES: PadR family transcriptional regulator [Pseudomonas]MCF4980032.1 PadR family transcriptional regulator [Pseudomonas gessardii]MCF4990886.1 PadR family transcriptional regulator [Pseudomonas gessardii]MCF5083613.1 PadR family transcriptional regulator [Pseudomonas gessardii]MCF5096113.1 PadR family transcriptional regulator [Pseudomonas gessardii]MCF5106214.1 PadR family transcriptional regulator [Pseudomonas gessardii]